MMTPRLMTPLKLGLSLLLFLAPFALASDRPWREIRSPHFRVITDGSENDARNVARAFEQMRAMFSAQFPTFRVDSPASLLILAPEDESSTKKLVPAFWQHPGPKPAGVYFHGWEKQYALIRLDAIGSDKTNPDTFAVVYHEYVHSLLHMNFRWLPTWLDEGLAEYYAYTRFEGNKIYIGAPPRNAGRLMLLRNRTILPLPKFLEQRGSFTRDETDTQAYYAQCWALTHFLTMAPSLQGGKLRKFFNLLQQGVPQQKAFQDTFGDMSQVQKDFDIYLHQLAFSAGVIPAPNRIDEKSFSARALTVPETEAELGSFYLTTHQWKLAQEVSETAAKEDPKSAIAHENLAFVALQHGKDDEATREFSRALELDDHLYRSLFARTMLSSLPHGTSHEEREAYRSALMKVLDGNPLFAPVFVELAKSVAAEGDLPRALALARTAEKLEPSRAGYHLLTGQILLRMGQTADAAAHAAYVADRWEGPDHDEALELLARVPLAQRPPDAPSDSPAPDVLTAEGIVKSVVCNDRGSEITIDRSGQPLTFTVKGVSGGFSDTLWVGEDHFSLCYHITGLRAVFRYKAGADKATVGQLLSWGIRDDLPPVSNPPSDTQHPN
ncbi:MAG TPA: DUF1570 domain-containing protein [Terriglobales bacterium]|nr:DUF1570 domain-containing protein [Terriglobales bacterium]